MPTADAHLHLFADGYCGLYGSSPAGGDELAAYERLREHHGIERGLVLGYEGEPRYAGNTDHVLALARTRPWMAVLAFLPMSAPPSVPELRELQARGAAGFALYPDGESDARALNAWPTDVFTEMRRQSAVVSINADPEAAACMARAVDKLDGCAVVFSHLGSPGVYARPPDLADARERLSPLVAFARHEHVMVKLSGLYAVSDPPHAFPHQAAHPFVDVLLEAFGASHLLWGSDFSPALDYVTFSQAADTRALSGCSAAEVDAVMGDNLLRLLLSRPAGSSTRVQSGPVAANE
jgi:L-fucono-1,5-lactonase